MISVDIEEITYLAAGKRPRLEVGFLPYEVCKYFGTSRATVLLSTESVRHILEAHGDHIDLKNLVDLPIMLQRGLWIKDRENHCAVVYYSPHYQWHFHAAVKVTTTREETLLVSFRKSRTKAVQRVVRKGIKLRDHW